MSTNIQVLPGKVGISNTSPTHTLDIGSNVYVDDTADNKLTVVGKIYTTDITVSSNLQVMGTTTVVNTENLSIKDPIIELARDSVGTGDTGILMKRAANESNVAVFYDEGAGFKISHTMSGANGTQIVVDTANALPINLYGNVTVTSNLEVGTANLFVDTVTGNVGVGTTLPSHQLTTPGRVRIGPALSFADHNANHVKCVKYFVSAGHWLVATGSYAGSAFQWLSVKAIAARLNTTPREISLNIRGGGGTLNVYDVRIVGNDGAYNNELLVFKKTSDSTYYVYASIDSASTWTFDITHRNSTIDEDGSTFVAGALDTTDLTAVSNTATDVSFSYIDGNVGIGTNSPASKLYVDNGVLVVEDTSETSTILLLPDGDGTGASLNRHFIGNTHVGVAQFVSEQEANTSTIAIINKDRDNNTTKNASIGFYNTDAVGTSKYAGKIGFWPADANAVENEFRVYTSNTVTSGAGYDYPQQRFVINKDGNVGIGTSSAEDTLHVEGGNILLSNVGGYINDIIYAEAPSDPASSGNVVLRYDGVGAAGANKFYIGSLYPSWPQPGEGFTYQPSTGRVGIGTGSPGYKLDVHGTSNVGALTATTLSGDGSGLTALNATNISSGTINKDRLPTTLNNTTIGSLAIGANDVTLTAKVDYHGLKIIKTFDNPDEPATLLLAGDGDPGDDIAFEVRGNESGASVDTSTTRNSNHTTFGILHTGHTYIGYANLNPNEPGGAAQTGDPMLNVNGDIYAVGNVAAYSDKRAKSDIKKIENALEKIEQLNGYTFTMNDKRYTGVIAQEVLPVLPEAVTGSEETNYAVAYGNMMGLIIEAIKELKEKIG